MKSYIVTVTCILILLISCNKADDNSAFNTSEKINNVSSALDVPCTTNLDCQVDNPCKIGVCNATTSFCEWANESVGTQVHVCSSHVLGCRQSELSYLAMCSSDGQPDSYNLLMCYDSCNDADLHSNQLCSAQCGNGKTSGPPQWINEFQLYVNVNEQCDDGNTNNGDGCSSQCKIENGFYCYYRNPEQNNIMMDSFSGTIIPITCEACRPKNSIVENGYLQCCNHSYTTFGTSYKCL